MVSLMEERAPAPVQRCWAADLSYSRCDRVSSVCTLHLPLGCCKVQSSRQSGQLVALPYRCAVFSGVPDDMASAAVAFHETIVDSGGTTFDLDSGALSICGTMLVEIPFLVRLGNLARMNQWRRLSIVCPTFGIIIASGAFLFLRRRDILPTRACLVGLNAAYLANAALCLIVYGPMPGTAGSRSGGIVTIVIVWPMLVELVWLFIQTFKIQVSQDNSSAGQYTVKY